MRTNTLFCCVGLFVFTFGIHTTVGQATEGSPTETSQSLRSSNQVMLQAFQAEQLNLGRQEQALIAAGATPQELDAWRKQNAAQFALQKQRALALAAASNSALETENHTPNIPANASPTLKAFLTGQAQLANARAHIHNQIFASASSQGLTPAQVNQLVQREAQLFQQRYGAQVKLQALRAKVLALASAQTVRPVPPPVVIPSDATPQMAAYLTARSQLRRSRIELMNQYASATPAARDAALLDWYRQNAVQLKQLQQEALALSPATTN